MRFCLVYIVTLSNLAVLSSSVTCENPFSASFLAIIDQTLDQPILLDDDPDLTFLRDVVKFNDDEVDFVTQNAIEFFNDVYGLDFSLSTPNEQNERFFENARMYPFILRDEIEYKISFNNWINSGNTRSSCVRMRDGGFGVTFSANQTLYGSYGGVDGRPAEFIVYGFYYIPVCEQSPVIIQYQSGTPFRAEPIDGLSIINCDLYNRVLGFGNAKGVATIVPDENEPGRFRVIGRNAFTFPRID